jgi:hypothetical protein
VRKKVLIALAVLAAIIIGFVVVVAMQPSEFRIERSLAMAAPPEAVFAQVNDFHKWEAWSPWLKVDPNAKGTYEGPTSGEGAIFRWAGNDEVGQGSMTITQSKPSEFVRIDLHFIKPFEGTAVSAFTLQPAGDQTTVIWSMDGKNNFISKALCLLVMDMDEMIGSKYEEGLASMKKIVEAAPQEAAPQEAASPEAVPAEAAGQPSPAEVPSKT